MKKISMLVAGLIAIAYGSAQAQIKNDRGTFTKPDAGEMTFETQMSPNVAGGTIFSLNDLFLQNLLKGIDNTAVDNNVWGENNTYPKGSVSPTLPMIRVRKFKDANTAFRGLVNLSIASNTTKVAAVDSDSLHTPSKAMKMTNGQWGIAIGVGIEKHQAGAERLSTYYGADITLGYGKYHNMSDNGTSKLKSSQGGFGFGLRAFTGFDYYFIPKVYLGLELGYGFGINSYGVVKNSDTTKGSNVEDGITKNSNLTFTPYITPSFRLGYRL